MQTIVWRKCSSCKKDLFTKQKYYVCSVSSCTVRSTDYAFCSIACWERHLPIAKHRDAGAVEAIAPTQAVAESSGEGGVKRIVRPGGTSSVSSAPKEVLIVASKLKDYIKARADMNTSASVLDILSDKVRQITDDAIDQARAEGRKTVLDRDFK